MMHQFLHEQIEYLEFRVRSEVRSGRLSVTDSIQIRLTIDRRKRHNKCGRFCKGFAIHIKRSLPPVSKCQSEAPIYAAILRG